MYKALRGLLVMALSTLVAVGVSGLLSFGAFEFSTFGVAAGFVAALAGATWFVYCLVGAFLTMVILPRTKNPGALMMTGLTFVGYLGALPALAALLPGVVLMNFAGMILFALWGTGVLWACWSAGVFFGTLPAIKTFLPEV